MARCNFKVSSPCLVWKWRTTCLYCRGGCAPRHCLGAQQTDTACCPLLGDHRGWEGAQGHAFAHTHQHRLTHSLCWEREAPLRPGYSPRTRANQAC